MPKADKIAIKTVSKPAEEDARSLTDWFFESFDLSGKGDDQEREMFREIVSSSLKGIGISSKEISKWQNLPRSTVIYDLNKFIDSGLVVRKGRKYYLRASDFESTIQELQAEMLTEFNRMMQFASRLDEIMEGEIHGKREKGTRSK
jgi:predicted transcriptional regulator